MRAMWSAASGMNSIQKQIDTISNNLSNVNTIGFKNQRVEFKDLMYEKVNTEDFADIVPPCQGLIGVGSDDEGTGMSNPDLAEGGVIAHHTGIVDHHDPARCCT